MKPKYQYCIKYILQRLSVAALVISILVPMSACCNCTECPKNLLAEENTAENASRCCSCLHQAEKRSEQNHSEQSYSEHQHQSGSVPCECACVKPAVPFVQNNTQVADLQLFAVSTPVCFALPENSALLTENSNAFLPAADTVILFRHLLI